MGYIKGTLAVALILLAVNCTGGKVAERHRKPEAGVGNSNAVNFRITHHDNYTRLDIFNPWQRAGDVTHSWFLVMDHNTDLSQFPENAEILRVPLKSIVCMSATHVAMIEALGMEEAIVAISGTDLIYNSSIRELINRGRIRETGYDDNINKELMVELKPGLVMAYGIGAESAGYYARLKELGLKVMFNADYLEPDPLGKAEWLRVFGELFCRRELADSLFQVARDEYLRVCRKAEMNSGNSPVVMMGLPWKDTWFVSPGNSYTGRLISDAGGNYLWKDLESDYSLPVSLESIFSRASSAGIWLNPGAATCLDDIVASDSRLQSVAPVTNGMVFNNNRRSLPSGANDYWETGTLRPGLILNDLVMIFNPGYLTGDSLYFFRKLKWK